MVIVPLQAVPSQVLNITLDGQSITLNVYAAGDDQAIYVDIYVNNSLILGGVFGLIGVRLVRDSYLGLQGDFVFVDTQPSTAIGPENPQYGGLGQRWTLDYLYPSDLEGDC